MHSQSLKSFRLTNLCLSLFIRIELTSWLQWHFEFSICSISHSPCSHHTHCVQENMVKKRWLHVRFQSSALSDKLTHLMQSLPVRTPIHQPAECCMHFCLPSGCLNSLVFPITLQVQLGCCLASDHGNFFHQLLIFFSLKNQYGK